MPAQPSALRGAIYGIVAFALYSLSDITIKFLGADYSPFQIMFFSGMAGFPLIFLQMMSEKAPATLRPTAPKWTVVRMGLVILNSFFVSYAFAELPLSQAYAIFFLMPLFICVLAVPTLGEPIDLPRGLAVVAGLIGVIVVLRPGTMQVHWAHLSALTGAAIGAFYYVIVRKTGGRESMAVLMLYPTLAQVVAMGLVLPFVYVPMPALHLGLNGLMSLTGFLGSIAIVLAYRHAPAVVVAPMQYIQIVVATLFGTFYFGETTDTLTVLGIAIIIAAGLFILTRPDATKLAGPAQT